MASLLLDLFVLGIWAVLGPGPGVGLDLFHQHLDGLLRRRRDRERLIFNLLQQMNVG